MFPVRARLLGPVADTMSYLNLEDQVKYGSGVHRGAEPQSILDRGIDETSKLCERVARGPGEKTNPPRPNMSPVVSKNAWQEITSIKG